MARVTVEDCIDKVPNRFELMLLARPAHRARALADGSQITIDAENDKNAVIALREIVEKTVEPGDVREGLIHSTQGNAEVDEPESTAVPPVPHLRRAIVGDERSIDTATDLITEEELLKRLAALTPVGPSSSRGSDRGRQGG